MALRFVLLSWILAALVAACSARPPPAVEDGGVVLEEDAGAPPPADAGPAPLSFTPIERLYLEPRDGRGFLTTAISGASSTIDAVFYILTDDTVESRLVAAKNRGVRVRVILDPDQPANGSARARLADAGVEVRGGPGSYTHVHQKTLVVDMSRAFIMTLNPSAAAFNDNREYAVAVTRREELDDMRRVFDADWNLTGNPPISSTLVVSPTNSRARLTALVQRGTQDLLVTTETFSDSAFRSLLKARLDAGATVRVLLADPRDVAGNSEAASAMRALGFQVRFLQTPMLHAKLIVVDGRLAYTGSVNLTRTSFELNREVGVVIDDATVVGQLRTQAEADWSAGTP